MKKISFTLIALLIVIVLCVASSSVFYAETIFYADGFSYTLMNDNYISIYDWDGGSDELIIPSTLDQSYIREIKDRCLLYRDDFSTLDLSQADYLNRIGISAFKGSSVSGVLTIPAQVKTVASGAFENCDNLEVLYYNAMSELITSQCFYDCDALSEVYIDDGITTIENHAFSNCDSLSLVRIPESVTSISSSAFANDENLVIYCYYNSYAQQYAIDNGIEYVLIDPPAPTEPTEEPTETPTEEPTDEPTQEPTEAPTEAPTESVRYVLGDVDNNGLAETIDSTWIQRYNVLMDLPDTLTIPHGDVDGDGDVSLIDATFILRYCIQMDVPYPIGELVES